MKKNKLTNELPDWTMAQHVISAYEVIKEQDGFTTRRMPNDTVTDRLDMMLAGEMQNEINADDRKHFKIIILYFALWALPLGVFIYSCIYRIKVMGLPLDYSAIAGMLCLVVLSILLTHPFSN